MIACVHIPYFAALIMRRLNPTLATLPFPAVEEHDVLAFAHKFHVGIGAWFCA
jgi:hypothetical protein